VDSRRRIRDASLEVTNRADRLSQSRAISEMEFFRIRQETERSKLEFDLSERAQATARMKREQLLKENASQQESWALTLEQLESDRLETDAALAKAKHQSGAAAREFEELKRSLTESKQKASIRIAALQRELDHSKENEVSVLAPCAATILRLQVKGNGAFVRTGDVLCELAPGAKELQAELSVAGSGIGRITAEQRAKLLYEAFPYQRHGVKHGTVRWVSPGSVTQGDGAVFRVLVDVDEQSVRVDGQERPLRPGMGGRAEVVVGRRSLISFAVEPLRQLKETMGDAPAKP
jgi:multidrug efflux pump subunit AcrA (membrane-fusion protein)